MQLDRGGRTVGVGAAFDHVGIQRPLGQKVRVFDLGRLFLEAFDERVPDAASLLLRFADAAERIQETVFGMDDVQVGLEVVAELANHQSAVRSCEAIRCRPGCKTVAARSPCTAARRRLRNRRRR